MKDVSSVTLDRLSREATRRMYKQCRKCGNRWHSLEVSHFIRRSNITTRWNPTNLDLLCGGCHSQLQQDWSEYQHLKRQWDGDIVVIKLCRLNKPVAYKPYYTAREFRLASHVAISELLRMCAVGAWNNYLPGHIQKVVFRSGRGVVEIPPMEKTL